MPCDFPPFHPRPPSLFFFFCAWIFYLCYSLGTLQSNKPPSSSPVLDLEPKLETAWLEQRGGSQKRGRCGYWTEQIAPLQSAFYPKTPKLEYPHPSPSNHGSACFPLIIYLVTRWCFLPYFVTFKRGRNLKRWMLNGLKLNNTILPSPPPTCQSGISKVNTVAWEKKQEKCQHSLTANSWDPLPVSGCYCPTGLQSSNRRMSQHVRSGPTAGVYVAPRHLWAVCLPSEAQCEETC